VDGISNTVHPWVPVSRGIRNVRSRSGVYCTGTATLLPSLVVRQAWELGGAQGLCFRREAFSRLSPGTGNRPVPGENRQKPDGMALQIQKSGNRFSRPGTGVF